MYMITAQDWRVEEADFVTFSDASLTGLGFWVPSNNKGYYVEVPFGLPTE
jgi:hypothetical protein